ncbi:MAG: hypothetical protein J6A89_08880 [Clostridia bacterium]|nr:hypothetical protein [Clostridia bacterium]
MKKQEAINYLETLEIGKYVTVNIPIYKEVYIPVTAMYLGKDKEGRYNFEGNGKYVFSKEFLERSQISLDKEYDKDKAFEVYTNFQKGLNKKKNNKDIER